MACAENSPFFAFYYSLGASNPLARSQCGNPVDPPPRTHPSPSNDAITTITTSPLPLSLRVRRSLRFCGVSPAWRLLITPRCRANRHRGRADPSTCIRRTGHARCRPTVVRGPGGGPSEPPETTQSHGPIFSLGTGCTSRWPRHKPAGCTQGWPRAVRQVTSDPTVLGCDYKIR